MKKTFLTFNLGASSGLGIFGAIDNGNPRLKRYIALRIGDEAFGLVLQKLFIKGK